VLNVGPAEFLILLLLMALVSVPVGVALVRASTMSRGLALLLAAFVGFGAAALTFSGLILVVVWLIPLVLTAWGVLDAALRPDSAWATADQSKLVWVIVQLLLLVVGPVAYLVAVRPRVREAELRMTVLSASVTSTTR
jgi:Phospholipase_D-nuclease N-terminal